MEDKKVRLQCSNCATIKEFSPKGGLPERCSECNILVGWLPPNKNLKDSGCRKTA
jgi:hypothetical protein